MAGGLIAAWTCAAEWSDVSGDVGGDAADHAETSRPSWRTVARVRARGVSESSKRTVQGEQMKWNYLAGFGLIVVVVFMIFKTW
jgi:hypothetical protein